MAVTSTNKLRGRGAAQRRKATYTGRLIKARTDRDRFHALVWWWMSEVKALTPEQQQTERTRLERIAEGLNEGRIGDDSE